jgi:hypothetical protein
LAYTTSSLSKKASIQPQPQESPVKERKGPQSTNKPIFHSIKRPAYRGDLTEGSNRSKQGILKKKDRAIMTYKVVWCDGAENIGFLEFEDRSGYLIYEQSMRLIKDEAARIVAAANDDVDNLREEDVNAMRNWIRRVDEMVEVRTPVLPSVLRVRNEFAEAINDR